MLQLIVILDRKIHAEVDHHSSILAPYFLHISSILPQYFLHITSILPPYYLYITPISPIHATLNSVTNRRGAVQPCRAVYVGSALSHLSAVLSSRSCESRGSYGSGGSAVSATARSSLFTRLALDREMTSD